MNYVGLFEGISGFGLAFKRAGATIKAVCEIDKTCQSVLRRHHPEARIISDVKTINKDTFSGYSVDILAGGFPCQDLSVAGLRKGLDGERSGLWFEFLRIITDHKPRIVVIENVPGLLSSNSGRDFAIILRGLAECGYGVCWRVFDSQYDGVAQRRARVFIVASLGDASCAEILFERESGIWDSAPSREAGQGVTGTLAAGAHASGFNGQDAYQSKLVTFGLIGNGEYADRPATLRAKGGDCGGGSEHLIAPTLRSNGDAHSGFTTGDGLVIEPKIYQDSEYGVQVYDSAGTLRAGRIPEHQMVIASRVGVRRLTPVECERLMAFPDDWTKYDDKGKIISDSARYRMLGNSVVVNTAYWIAQRIMRMERQNA